MDGTVADGVGDLLKELGSFSEGSEKLSKSDSVERKRRYTDSGSKFGAVSYDAKREILRVPVVLAKEMVYSYDDYNAFRPREELEAIAPFLTGVPVTRNHPPGGLVTDRSEVMGSVVDATFKDEELQAVLEIVNKELIEDIRSGELKGVSPGHFSNLVRTENGMFEGVHYDATQRDIYIDHVAVVQEGRCSTSDGCGLILDAEAEQEKKEVGGKFMEIPEKKVVSKIELVIKIAEDINKRAEAGKAMLNELKELKEMPEQAVAKIGKIAKIVEGIADEGKREAEKLEEMKEALAGAKKEEAKVKGESEYPKPPARDAKSEAIFKKVTDEVLGIRKELDAIKDAEKEELVGELHELQDVKKVEDLKKLSIDELSKDLEMVRAVKEKKKLSFDDEEESGGRAAISKAYRTIGGGR